MSNEPIGDATARRFGHFIASRMPPLYNEFDMMNNCYFLPAAFVVVFFALLGMVLFAIISFNSAFGV